MNGRVRETAKVILEVILAMVVTLVIVGIPAIIIG
jgi:hypothetical protein